MEYWIIPAFLVSPKHIKSIRLNPNISKYWEFGELKVLGLDTKKWYDIQICHELFYYYTPLQMRRLWNWQRSIGCSPLPRFPPQKHIPTTLVGIPVVIYTLVAKSTGVRVTAAQSLIRDLGRVSEWCDLWGMKLNASKTKTMIVSRSRIMHPQCNALTIGGTVLKETDDLVILGVTFDSKMTFENHLHSVSRAALLFCSSVYCSAVRC